jgi:hypothetical protein
MLTFNDEKVVRNIVKEEVKIQLTDFRSEIKSLLDRILKGVVANREEMIVVQGHKDQIEDHEIRITKIEKKLRPIVS